MKSVLLDENVPRLLKGDLPQFDVRTVGEMGWSGKENGELLQLAEAVFDVLLTADRRMPTQQNLAGRGIGVVVLETSSTKLEDIRPHIVALRDAITSSQPGAATFVPARGAR